jgi:hypothetical protein
MAITIYIEISSIELKDFEKTYREKTCEQCKAAATPNKLAIATASTRESHCSKTVSTFRDFQNSLANNHPNSVLSPSP